MSKSEFLTPHQVVQRWGGAVTIGTLANWRCKDVGPSYSKMRGRVVYSLADIETWEAKNARPVNDNNAKAKGKAA